MNIFGLAKNQKKNMQLNQPSVMKNSTVGGNMLSKATVNQFGSGEVAGAMSSQVLISAGKKSLSRVDKPAATEASNKMSN